jgi:hypothetical protein
MNAPSGFQQIRENAFKEQEQGGSDVDCIFDAPLDLAESITTIRHDIDEDDQEYVILKSLGSTKKNPWWKIW